MRVKTSTGIVLDTDELAAPSITDYAHQRGLTDIIACVATEPSGAQSYVLLRGQTPVYESKSLEACGAYIDVLAFQANGHAKRI